jgi:hypothetical protein
MRNLFKIFAFVAIIGSLLSFVDSENINAASTGGAVVVTKFTPAQTQNVIQAVHELNGVVKTELLLDTTRAGVCDTCMSAFTDVLKVNRKLSDSLNVENSILYENWIKTIALNDTLERVQKLVKAQILRSKKSLVRE